MNPFFQNRNLLLSLGLLVALGVLAAFLLFVPPSSSPLSKTILIKRGMPLRNIAILLQEEGMIRNRHAFILLATFLGKRTGIKAGEYELTTRMLPLEILNNLVGGQVKRHLVTFAEGFTLGQIARLLEESGIVERDAFIRKATSPLLIATLGLSEKAGGTLEGYLFPETYHLMKEMDPEEVIRIMVNQFNKILPSDFSRQASELGIAEREAIILASMIEKETSLAEEKPLVSAVFHNRLRRKIPLQSDPTVIYGVKNFDGNLTKAHLMEPTPYNTYLVAGLPPTPICNPGKDSILAAIRPASVPYLYFVSKNDGSHFFSGDFEDHTRAVWKFQKSPRRNHLTKK